MNIALVGTGQMGQAVASVASDAGHDISVRFDSDRPFGAADVSSVADVDVAVDFSLPSVALSHIRRYCAWSLPAVIGTTGWYDEIDDVERLVADQNASLLYAPNFSMGIAIVRKALVGMLPLLDRLDDYDPFIQEVHHTKKVDSPSGTAEMLAEEIVHGLSRKDHVESETQHQRIDPSAVHVTATRAGTVYGEHTVGFDGPYDQITVGHRAKNREGFAAGAVRAAEWLNGRQGFFSLEDMLNDWLDE